MLLCFHEYCTTGHDIRAINATLESCKVMCKKGLFCASIFLEVKGMIICPCVLKRNVCVHVERSLKLEMSCPVQLVEIPRSLPRIPMAHRREGRASKPCDPRD